MIRKAAVAGQFYPDDPRELEKMLAKYCPLMDTPHKRLQVLVSPHAGMVYSGPTAGKGYSLLRGQAYKQIILLGVSHQGGFRRAVTDDSEAWETPLGEVEVATNELIQKDAGPHIEEHSLEMQLIFLQHVLTPGFKIIPILIGRMSGTELKSVGDKLGKILNPETLLVISSDLSHYPTGEVAEKCDKQVIDEFCSGNADKFTQIITELESAGLPNYFTAACGALAMTAGLMATKNMTYQLINYSHAGMITGDNSRVVGYASIAGYQN